MTVRLPRSLLAAAGLLVLGTAAGTLAAPAWSEFARQPDDWYRSAEGRRVTENVLSWQSAAGSWPKNQDNTAKAFTGDRATLKGTFDNGATTGELRFLARAFRATQNARCQQAFLRGLDHILQAQYPTGGWPQSYPPGPKYPRYITFNDDAMVRLMRFVREVATAADYEFVDRSRRQVAARAFERGIECILKCQISANGKLTAWCAQHDEVDYQPRPARAYELVSLSGAESAGILQWLMSLEKPGADVIRAVKAGAEWFETVKLTGIRVDRINGDKRVVKDPTAPPLWARFYEIGSNRPFFCGRDGVKKYDLAEIEAERRNGYAWFGTWGAPVAATCAAWKQKWLGAGEASR